jgi:hypothetical protein
MSILNPFKTTLYTTCFDCHWSSLGVLKLFIDTAVLEFCASNFRCLVPSHIHVFHRAGCFLLLRCVLRPLAGENTHHDEKHECVTGILMNNVQQDATIQPQNHIM